MFVLGPLLHNTAAFVGSVSSFATMNPADNLNNTLSNGNLTVTGSASSGWTRATRGVSSGKVYWELTVTSNTSTTMMPGIADGSAVFATSGANAWWWNASSIHSAEWATWRSEVDFAGAAAYAPPAGAAVATDVLQFALDATAQKLWVGKNNTFAGSPSAGTGGLDLTTGPIGTPIYPGIATADTSEVAVFNFGATAYAFTPPTGFGNV